MSIDRQQSQQQGSKYDFDLTALDGQCRDILRTIDRVDGAATSKQLKADAGVDKNSLHYRLDNVLEDIGLVETYSAKPETGGKRLKHASLTDKGRQAVADGLLEDITDANSSLRQLRRDINRVKERIGEKADQSEVSFEIDSLYTELSELRAVIDEADSTDDVSAIRNRLDALEDELGEISTAVDERAGRVRDVENQTEGLHERLADLTTQVDSLRDEVVRRDRGVNVVALAKRTRELADQLDNYPQQEAVGELRRHLDELEARLGEQDQRDELEQIEQRLSDVESEVASRASTERVDDLEARVEAVENVTGEVAEQSENNRAKLQYSDEKAEYIGLQKGQKREYWRDKARERIQEIGCRHAQRCDHPEFQDWKLLAHLDDAELRLLCEEDLFHDPKLRRAVDSKVPVPCRHGWTYHLFGFFYEWQSDR